jgi:glutamate N-acetyltransferase/amino-acid N-acetyltransferase
MDAETFSSALRAGCIRMAEVLARDGEGATKLLRVTVRGAADEDEARRVAKSVVNSPLIKTMAHGADPNVGRILMAIGKCFDVGIEPSLTHAFVNGTKVVRGGERSEFVEGELREALKGDPVDIVVDLGVGSSSAVAFGCDLTCGYIEENAAYFSS